MPGRTTQDTTAPILASLPTDQLTTSAQGATVTYASPTATDAVDQKPAVSC